MTNEEAVQTLYPHDVNAARLLRALLVAHGLMECAEARTEKANRKAVM